MRGSCAVSFRKAASARARSRPSRCSAAASLVLPAGRTEALLLLVVVVLPVRKRVGDRERARRGGGGMPVRAAASSSSVGSRELKGPCRPQAPPSGPRGERGGGERDCVCRWVGEIQGGLVEGVMEWWTGGQWV